MCKGLEDLKQEYAEIYAKQHVKEYAKEYTENCVKQQAIESAKIMLEDGISIERAAKYSNLSIETVEELQKSLILQ